MKQWVLVTALAVTVGAMVAGCSSKTTVLPGVQVDNKTGSVSVKTDQGSVEVSGGNDKGGQAKVPDGFPYKVISGAKVDSSMKTSSNGKVGYTLALTLQQDPKKVADFYVKELEGSGLKVDRQEIESDGSLMITLTGDGEKNSAWVSISQGKDEKDVTISIIWGEK